MSSSDYTRSILIDRIDWDLFLVDSVVMCRDGDVFIDYIFSLNDKLIKYELKNKQVVMNILIDDSDIFFYKFKSIFEDTRV